MTPLATLHLLLTWIGTAFAYTALSDDTLRALPSPGSDFDIKTGALLSPLMRTRVVGTPGQDAAITHFVDFFHDHLPKWKLSIHNSTSTTPLSGGKELPFHNIIATRDPPWIQNEGDVSRLALVAHFDSKIEPEGFIGATDSAAPCAMILHAVRSIDAALTKKWEQMEAEGVGNDGFGTLEEHKGVQVLLLDGEEAFQAWTRTDSLYGARALAEDWEKTKYGAASTFRTPLHSIELFVLLDLLGAANPRIPSYFKLTHWAYQHMGRAEQRLRKLDLLKTRSAFLQETDKSMDGKWHGGFVEDDHVPFMQRGVDVLHIIPTPFPRVWHTMDDDGEHLDMDSVNDWALITTAFAAEWMELEGYFDIPATVKKAKDPRDDGGRTELILEGTT